MKDVNLCDFSEITLVGDMKYLRFVDNKSNKLYLVEDYNPIILEEKIERINKFKSIKELIDFFNRNNSKVFEFVNTKDIKFYLDTIKKMNDIEKKQLTEIIKKVKEMEITYVNFTYFFFETANRSLYYSHVNKKKGEISLKNLKIINVIKPADISVILRDIKAYGAFKYHGSTIKYSDIEKYVDDVLLTPDTKYEWLVKKLREKKSEQKVQNIINENYLSDLKKDIKNDTIEYKKDDIKDVPKKNDKKDTKVKKAKIKKHSFKNSIWMYCLIGFTVGVLLAAITIIIGTFA